MKYSKTILSIVIALSFTACTNDKPKEEKEEQVEEATTFEEENRESNLQQDERDKDMANSILSDYLDIKDALVDTDPEAANSEAKDLVASLNENETGMFLKIKNDANKIANTTDVEEQRKYFETLSDNVYEMAKTNKAKNTTLYRQYCPMAMNNKGAYWLSDEDKIRNPYFGDKMLKCGSVKETL